MEHGERRRGRAGSALPKRELFISHKFSFSKGVTSKTQKKKQNKPCRKCSTYLKKEVRPKRRQPQPSRRRYQRGKLYSRTQLCQKDFCTTPLLSQLQCRHTYIDSVQRCGGKDSNTSRHIFVIRKNLGRAAACGELRRQQSTHGNVVRKLPKPTERQMFKDIFPLFMRQTMKSNDSTDLLTSA